MEKTEKDSKETGAACYSFAEQSEVFSPQLVFYPDLILDNIRRMIKIAGGAGRLWPHIKTHKTPQVVQMLVEEGIDRFKCATIAELEMAARAGGKRLLLAYPLVGPDIKRFLAVQKAFREVTFYAIADDTDQVKQLGQEALRADIIVNLLMDADLGQHRTGVPMERLDQMYREWDKVPGIHMCGMHCYDGHRHEADLQVRMEKVRETDELLKQIWQKLREDGYDLSVVVLGGTPSFPCHKVLTEEYLSPGTCVIHDAGYRDSYRDMEFTPAAAVLTRVVSRPERDTFTLDLGTKAVASDPAGDRAVLAGMEYAATVMQNEEHWVVRVPEEHIKDIPEIGTELFAIPVHVCPTSALYPEAAVVREGHLRDWWAITARNRKITF
ncbi:MAG: D-TA family PLP-dependent enzyme [Lachnospiraceae bacterium]|nr:D-TA family PLP-dependent enzyme [Lachnospiraceae bacterium]